MSFRLRHQAHKEFYAYKQVRNVIHIVFGHVFSPENSGLHLKPGTDLLIYLLTLLAFHLQ